MALTVIVIDQNTLGASAKKACQRLLGTALGVIAGILLAHFLFGPYPLSRWSALFIVFLTFSIRSRQLYLHYFLCYSITGKYILCIIRLHQYCHLYD